MKEWKKYKIWWRDETMQSTQDAKPRAWKIHIFPPWGTRKSKKRISLSTVFVVLPCKNYTRPNLPPSFTYPWSVWQKSEQKKWLQNLNKGRELETTAPWRCHMESKSSQCLPIFWLDLLRTQMGMKERKAQGVSLEASTLIYIDWDLSIQWNQVPGEKWKG